MASLMDDLIAIMEKEAICYEDYLIVANNKKEVIIQGNVPSLQEIIQKEEIVAGQLFRLEKERKTVVEDICTVTNRKPETFTVSALIRDMASRPEESRRLQEAAERLTKSLEACHAVNEINKMLIEQSLEIVEFNINAVSGLIQGSKPPEYPKSREQFSAARSTFDTKR